MELTEFKIHLDLGKWTEAQLDKLIFEAAHIEDSGQRIKYLSDFFIGLEYKESTLIGDTQRRRGVCGQSLRG